MINIAVLITVFNRREITLKGLRTLTVAIDNLGGEYHFDIYMTNDGCTDGTPEAVGEEFPQVIIVNGNGSLFWGGGMNLAWETAIEAHRDYDYYLWYNDDSELFPDALKTMLSNSANDVIMTGAFKGHDGIVSYGGRMQNDQLLVPNGYPQDVIKMNGNLVLIPDKIYREVGMIDNHFLHGGGDFDYGYKARKKGFVVHLTPIFVGLADRHSTFVPPYCNVSVPFVKRWGILHNPVFSPTSHFRYTMKREGVLKAIVYYLICYIGVLFPSLYVRVKTIFKRK